MKSIVRDCDRIIEALYQTMSFTSRSEAVLICGFEVSKCRSFLRGRHGSSAGLLNSSD